LEFREKYQIGVGLICIKDFICADNFSEFYEEFHKNEIYQIQYHYNRPCNAIRFKNLNLFIGEYNLKENFATITELRKRKLEKLDEIDESTY